MSAWWMVDGEGRGRLVGKGERRVMVAQYQTTFIEYVDGRGCAKCNRPFMSICFLL